MSLNNINESDENTVKYLSLMPPALSCVKSDVKQIHVFKLSTMEKTCLSQKESMHFSLMSHHYSIPYHEYKVPTSVPKPVSQLIQVRSSKIQQREINNEGVLPIHDRCPSPPKARRRILPASDIHFAMSAEKHNKVAKQMRRFHRKLQTGGNLVVLAIL